MPKPSLTIGILNWNNKDITEDCVESIYSNPPEYPFEIIIVDNASIDSDYSNLLAKYPDIKIIRNEVNNGFAEGNNQCFEAATGEYFLLLNNDTIVTKNALTLPIDFLEEHPEYAAATGKLLNQDGSTQMYMHRRFPNLLRTLCSFFYKRFNWFQPKPVKDYLYLDQDFDKDFDIEQPAGTLFFVRSSVIKKLGFLLDSVKFPIYFNDVDLATRLHENGYKARYIAGSKTFHLKGLSTKRLDISKTLRTYISSMYYYFKIHHVLISYIITKSILIPLVIIFRVLDLFKLLKNKNLQMFYKDLQL